MKIISTRRSLATRRIAISFSLLLASGAAAFAQCGKDVILNSSKTEYLDGSGALQRTVEEDSVIQISKSKVIITPGNRDQMTGTITSSTCHWKVPFKEGKTTLKASFEGDGQTKNATITIEGKDGKVTLLFETADKPDRKIRVPIDKFEEQK